MAEQLDRPESAAQRRANRIYRERLAEYLTALGVATEAARRIQRRIAREVRDEVLAIPASAPPDIVRRTVARIVRSHEAARREVVEAAIDSAALRGARIARRQAEAVFEGQARVVALEETVGATSAARRVAAVRRSGVRLPDDRTVARRLQRGSTAAVDGASRSIRSTMRSASSLREATRAVLDADDFDVAIPRYVRELREAARSAEPGAVRRAARNHARAFRDARIDEHNLGRANRRFLRRIESASEEDIRGAVTEWVEDRAGHQAVTVIRTETSAALNEAYYETTRESEWVVGYRVTLSGSHPRADICDVIANQNIYGLGPGGYPVDSTPAVPIHPNCLCSVTAIIDEHYFARRRARREGTAEPPRPWEDDRTVTGRQYLSRLSAADRVELLGPGRAREFRRRPNRVVNPDGGLNPLYQIQGRPRPEREGVEGVRRRSGAPLQRLEPAPPRTRRTRTG